MVSLIIRARAAVCALTMATAGLVTAAPAAHSQILPVSCADGWHSETMLAGAGNLENLDSDGAGGFYVTGLLDGYLGHISADGAFDKLVTGLDHPAGVRATQGSVYFLTGDGVAEAPGTLQRYDLGTGAVTVLLTGLNGPNGLLLLPDGDLLFTNIGARGVPTGISRYRPSTGEFTPTWSPVPLSNGLASAPDGRSIYTSTLALNLLRIDLTEPTKMSVVAGLPDFVTLPDDMEATRDGDLFVADHLAGAVYRVDPDTGAGCSVITGLIKRPDPIRMPPDGATSVRIARDGDSWALYVTSMDGTLRRLRPPPDVDLTPADATRR